MNNRPKIGITTYYTYDKREGFEGYTYILVSACYVNAIVQAGGIPFLLPLCELDKNTIQEQVAHLDGILISGGHDVHPKLWGGEAEKNLTETCALRDSFEYALIETACTVKKPLFGICRGAQILNVFFGGTLYQDIFTETDARLLHVQKTHYDETVHKVNIISDSYTHTILGDEVWVNSFHHMAVKDLAPRFRCTGRASDGIIEAFESVDITDEGGHFILGTQWHPEMLSRHDKKMGNLFSHFIAACSR